jgi:ATP-dependent Clp protease ATP-binding subunit ClpX
MANVPPKGGRKHPQQEFLKVDTTNILFICGGAFVGLEDIIVRRIGKSSMGFGAKIESKKIKKVGELLEKLEPTDLLRFGLIPEFVGRLPVVATLHELDEEALVDILRKPKNAIVRQYQKLFSMENVKLKFTEDALRAVARQALERKSGARGLRAILEESMMDIMFEVPSRTDVKEVIINEDVILKKEKPIMLFEKSAETA